MSHISTLETTTKFTDIEILKEALGSMGQIIANPTALSLVLPVGGAIRELSFIKYGNEWQARADNWGRKEQYKSLISKIETRYNNAALQRVLKRMHYNNVQKVSENQVIARRF